ncbi:MAG TPA: hypothetical protein VE441_09720 [Mycobacterium sp.]|nr:hypothetical protein [Mycobacterium sp.]
MRLFSPRWLLIHAIAVGLVLLFIALGWWQLHRAESGNTPSYAYALEWPTFALLVIGFWLKTMRDELRHTDADDARGADRRPLDDDEAELAAYNRYVAERGRVRDQR